MILNYTISEKITKYFFITLYFPLWNLLLVRGWNSKTHSYIPFHWTLKTSLPVQTDTRRLSMPFCVPCRRERCGTWTGAGTGLEWEQAKRSEISFQPAKCRLDNSRYHAGKPLMGFSVFMCCYQRNLGKGGQEPWTDKSKENFLDTVRLSRNKEREV